ncbi:hypothetical protein [Cerasicoccus maritimus]|uniref:hypothetical protein n=1 Tax=Cerasicoccus maritimus TaxID=490089 RepID=UPI002852C2FF|nr:hypothetical protein [Cerasicoccus maritimus]
MKALPTIATLFTTASLALAQNIDDPSPDVISGDVVLQSFVEENGNYTAAQFNSDSNTILTNFDSPDTVLGGSGTGFTSGNTLAGVLYNSANSGVNFRMNFQKNGGFGAILTNGSTFVSSPSLGLTFGNGSGMSIILPEFVFGSVESEEIYGIGFTLARLQTDATITLYSDTDGTNQIGSSVTFSENISGSGYSFFGYAGDTVIRRIDVDVDTNQFSIDDVIVTTSAIPEPSAYAGMVGVLALLSTVYYRRRNRK